MTGMTRRRYAAGAAAAAGGLAVACGPLRQTPLEQTQPTIEPQTIELWVRPDAYMQTAIDGFERIYPGLTVRTGGEGVGMAAAGRDKFLAAVVAGTPPDVQFMDFGLIRTFAAKSALSALDGYAKNSRTFRATDLWPDQRQGVTQKGRLYGLPIYTAARLFYWHKPSLLEMGMDPNRPPRTWDELELMASRLLKRSQDGRLERLGFHPWGGNPPGAYAFFLRLWQLGGETLTPDERKATFHLAPGIKALEWTAKLVQRAGGLEALTEVRQGFQGDPMALSRLALQIEGCWRFNPLERHKSQNPGFDYGFGPLPLPSGGRAANYHGGHALVLPKGARRERAAWAFMEYVLSKEAQLAWSDVGPQIPALKPLAQSQEYIKGEPVRKIAVEEMAQARFVPTLPGADEFRDIVIPLVQEAVEGRKTAKDALAEAAAKVQPLLDRNA